MSGELKSKIACLRLRIHSALTTAFVLCALHTSLNIFDLGPILLARISSLKLFVKVIFTVKLIGIHYKDPLINFFLLLFWNHTPSQIFVPDTLPNHNYHDCFWTYLKVPPGFL